MEPEEPKYFIVRVPMYGYLSSNRSWGNCYALRVGKVYEATHVGKQHLVMTHPEKPDRVLYVPLASKWYWSRVAFAPELPALGDLLT